MKMRDYFFDTFPKQLSLLEFHRPNQIVRENIMRDDAVIFFGGQDWKSVSDDLSRIPPNDRPQFILSLFMVILTDQCLYTYEPDAYPHWRRKTNFPKFGWSGFGPHNENPLKVLWAPERENMVIADDVIKLIPEFMVFMREETNQFFVDNLSTVNVGDYFNSIIHDDAYAFSEGNIVQSFKQEFETQINISG